MLFQISSVPFFSEIISRHGMKPDPIRLKALTEMPPQAQKEIANTHWNN